MVMIIWGCVCTVGGYSRDGDDDVDDDFDDDVVGDVDDNNDDDDDDYMMLLQMFYVNFLHKIFFCAAVTFGNKS